MIVQQINQQKLNLVDDFFTSTSTSLNNLIPVNYNDHVQGNRQAKIKIIEYGDLECSVCANFNPIMQEINKKYNNQIQWVYRHFPITSIHAQAADAAIASECVADLGGEAKFWQFINAVFANQKLLGLSLYQQLAAELNIDQQKFINCLESGQFSSKVNAHRNNAIESGATGTPFVVIELPDGTRDSFSGLASFEEMDLIIGGYFSK